MFSGRNGRRSGLQLRTGLRQGRADSPGGSRATKALSQYRGGGRVQNGIDGWQIAQTRSSRILHEGLNHPAGTDGLQNPHMVLLRPAPCVLLRLAPCDPSAHWVRPSTSAAGPTQTLGLASAFVR